MKTRFSASCDKAANHGIGNLVNIQPFEIIPMLLFVINSMLVLLDASLSYHLAPALFRLSDAEESELHETVQRTVRRLLPAMVALYMFFNCLGFFRGNTILLLIIAAIVLCDIAGQLYLRRR